MWEQRISTGSATPNPDAGPSVPQILEPPTYANMVWPRAINFGVVAQVGKVCVSRGQPRPHLKGGAPASPDFSALLPMPYRLNWTYQIRYGNVRGGACFHGFRHDRPVSQLGVGSLQQPQIFDTPYMHPHGMTHGNIILHVDYTRWHENFHTLDHAPAPAKISLWRAICLR